MSVQQTPHSTDNYAIGKGILHVASWSGTTPPTDPGDYSEMGNCPSIEIEPNLTRLPHYSSREQYKLKDKNPVTQTEYSVSFTCDEMAAVNLQKYLMGTLVGSVIYAMQATDEEFALKFVSDNPIGPNETWNFWRGTIAPNGPLSLIGDDWMVLSYTFEGLADTTNHAATPYFNVSYSSSSSSKSSSSSSSVSSSSSSA